MDTPTKIRIESREDLLKSLETLVLKKKDANSTGAFASLKKALEKVHRGDKMAINAIVKLRLRMLKDASEVYIELNEGKIFDAMVAEVTLIEQNIEVE